MGRWSNHQFGYIICIMKIGCNRRDFLKAGAFFIAAGGKAWGDNAPSNRVRFALVGCHRYSRGLRVATTVVGLPGVEIAVVCDVDSRARDFAAKLLGEMSGVTPRKEKDFRKVLEDPTIDAVISETPDHFHAWSAVMAMRAGKHVYVEKPCAYCPRECEIIMDTWRKTGKVMQVGSQRRSTPQYIEAIAAIRSGSLIGKAHWGRCWYNTIRKPIGRGRPVDPPAWLDWDLWQACAPREGFRDNLVHYNWHWFRKWGTGECGNNSVHFVDVARWALGVDYPERVTSTGGKFWMPDDQDWEWPDTQMISCNFPGGRFLTWEGTCSAKVDRFMGTGTGAVVYGDAGSVQFLPSDEVKVFDNNGKLVRKWNADPERAKILDTDNRRGTKDTTDLHFANFVDAIKANDPMKACANAEVGVKSTMLALLGNVSLDIGEAVCLDAETGRLLGGRAKNLWSREYEKGWELE